MIDKDAQYEAIIDLCYAVVIQACKDYKEALSKNDNIELHNLERFFYNGSFEQMTRYKIEPDIVIDELKKQVNSKKNKAIKQRIVSKFTTQEE